MGTRNFLSVNATGIYTIDTDDDSSDSEYLLESTQNSIIEDLKEAGLHITEVDAASSDNDSNFGGWCFALVYGTGVNAYATIEIIYRHGYYSSANFDYIIKYMVETEEYTPEDLSSAYVYSTSKGDYIDISKTEVKRLEANARALERKVAKILKANTEKIKTVGVFSDGTAVYERAN